MIKTPRWTLEPATAHTGRRVRSAAAIALLGASALLARVARQLHLAERAVPAGDPVLEFYAEAGAPEGALFVDGQRVGVLVGVTRL